MNQEVHDSCCVGVAQASQDYLPEIRAGDIVGRVYRGVSGSTVSAVHSIMVNETQIRIERRAGTLGGC